MLPMWLSDESAVISQRMLSRVGERLTPLLMVVGEVVEEGVCASHNPDHASLIVVSVVQNFNESINGFVMHHNQECHATFGSSRSSQCAMTRWNGYWVPGPGRLNFLM